MSDIHTAVLAYLCLMNLAAILLYGWDKYCAIHHRWRVPEVTLLFAAMIGGSIGAMAGMKLFHHKTLHWKVRLGVPLILLMQIAAGIYLHVPNIIR